MTIAKPVFLALLGACALAAPACAQSTSGGMQSGMDAMMLKEGMMTVVMPDGRMSTMASTDKMMTDAMMKDGKPMTTTHIMMMSGGKVMMMEDKKMSDGKMMSEHMTTMKK